MIYLIKTTEGLGLNTIVINLNNLNICYIDVI